MLNFNALKRGGGGDLAPVSSNCRKAVPYDIESGDCGYKAP